MMRAHLMHALGFIAALCAACEPGPTIYLGKRKAATAQPTDAGRDAASGETEDQERERTDELERAASFCEASCPEDVVRSRCDASSACAECQVDGDCGRRALRSQPRPLRRRFLSNSPAQR
jgi:hypothetical protein